MSSAAGLGLVHGRTPLLQLCWGWRDPRTVIRGAGWGVVRRIDRSDCTSATANFHRPARRFPHPIRPSATFPASRRRGAARLGSRAGQIGRIGGSVSVKWADIDVAPRGHVEKGIQSERRQIANDCFAPAMKVRGAVTVIWLLAGRDAHDLHGVADRVGRTPLAFRASRHSSLPKAVTRISTRILGSPRIGTPRQVHRGLWSGIRRPN